MHQWQRLGSLLALPPLFSLLALGGCGGGGTKSAAGGTNGSGSGGAAGDTSGGAGTTGSGDAGATGSGTSGTTGTAGVTGSGTAGVTGSGTAGTGVSGTSMSWQKMTNPFPSSCTLSADGSQLLAGPTPGELYASGYCGLTKSTDGGATWSSIADPTWSSVTGVGSVGFNDLGELVAGVGIDNTATGKTLGVWRLTGGKWVQGTGVTAGNSVSRLALDKTGALIAVTVGNGDVWRSTDHGATFPQRAVDIGSTGPITGHNGGLVALAVDRSTGDVYTGGEPWSGLYRSQDNGVTWAYFGLAATLVGGQQDPNGYKDNLLKIAFNRLGELLVGRNYQASSIQRLVKGGGWVQSSTGIDDLSKVHSIVMNPASGIVYAANSRTSGTAGGGIFTSTDDGATWKSFSTGYDTTLQTRGMAIGPDGVLYVLGKSTTNSLWRTTGAVP
jgi:collagen type VII alpha